jgi:steroid delta-isomerase-like uncharacterized protein
MSNAIEASRAIVLRMVDAWRGGDLDAAVAAYAPDFIYHNPVVAATPGLPPGPPGMRQLMAATRDAFPDLDYAVETIIAQDDRAAVLYRWSGTHAGDFGGIPATGRRVSATGAIFCRVVEGWIVEQWDIDDRLQVAQQLGLLPEFSGDGQAMPASQGGTP